MLKIGGLLFLIFVLFVGVGVAISLLIFKPVSDSKFHFVARSNIFPTVSENNATTKDNHETASANILLLGKGGADHPGGELTDAIQVVHVDFDQKTLTLIAVPRDIWVDGKKINAYYVDGIDHIKQAVSKVTGLTIDKYVLVDFERFVSAIDSLEGITVEVAQSFDDYFYPVAGLENETCGKTSEEITDLSSTLSGFELEKQFECRYEHLHFDQGEVRMDGETTLKFVRSRHSETYGGDFARGQRQQAVVVGLGKRLVSLGGVAKIDDFFSELAHFFESDVSLLDLKNALGIYPDMADYEVKFVGLSNQNVLKSGIGEDGQYTLIPKSGEDSWSEVKNYIDKAFEK